MLSRLNRFSLRHERQRLESVGVVRRHPLFTVILNQNSSLPAPRFAFLLSKKNFPLSVTRHALKRLLSEVIKQSLPDYPISLEAIIIPNRKIATVSQSDITLALKEILSH